MKKTILIVIVVVTVIALFSILLNRNATSQKRIIPPAQVENKNDEAITTVATELDVPWAIGFLPDGSMLVTERTGNLIKIMKGQKTTVAKLPIKIIGEGGLLGLAIDPKFSENNFIYLYYTYSSNNENTLNRVVRYNLSDNKLGDERILIDKIPGATFHNGGRIKFGPDGFLYITTGDAQEPSQAQDRNSLAGKILRITTDGKPAPGNPFKTLVYSYGHRNPQGIAWDDKNQLWQTEHGRSTPTGFDEVNKIEPGKNYGWPTIEGDETKDGMVTPVINSGPDIAWAPGGTAFLNGLVMFSGLRGQALYEYNISKNKLTEHLKERLGRIRDVVLGPDGFLYITTSNRDGRGTPSKDDDKILRINPAKLSEI